MPGTPQSLAAKYMRYRRMEKVLISNAWTPSKTSRPRRKNRCTSDS